MPRPRCATRSTLPLLVLLVATGCGDDSASETDLAAGPSVTDSAGIRIVQNGAPDPDRSILVGDGPTVEIGVVDGDDAYQLFRVSDARRLSDGGFAVANGGTRELRIYDADGTHRATAGGAGEGPSEFRYPRALAVLPGDTIRVDDFGDRVLFTAEGEFVRRETISRDDLHALFQQAGGFSEGGSWTGNGTLFAPVYLRDAGPSGPPRPGPLRRPPMRMVRVAANLGSLDTLGVYGGIRQQYVEMGEPRGVSSIVPPYSVSTLWATSPADGTIVVGDNAHPQFEFFRPDGSREIVRWTATPEPITEAEVEAWKEEQRNASWTQGQLPNLERGWAAMDIPEAKAFYQRAYAGSEGSVWVAALVYGDEPQRTFAFDADGHYRGTLTVPSQFDVFDAGPGWVLGVHRDPSTEVEFLRLYRVATE